MNSQQWADVLFSSRLHLYPGKTDGKFLSLETEKIVLHWRNHRQWGLQRFRLSLDWKPGKQNDHSRVPLAVYSKDEGSKRSIEIETKTRKLNKVRKSLVPRGCCCISGLSICDGMNTQSEGAHGVKVLMEWRHPQGTYSQKKWKCTSVPSALLQWPSFFLDKPLTNEIICSVVCLPIFLFAAQFSFMLWKWTCRELQQPFMCLLFFCTKPVVLFQFKHHWPFFPLWQAATTKN